MSEVALQFLGDDARHEKRRRELAALRVLLARTRCPIEKLPVELLLMVFDLVCKPVMLAQVCRLWRQVALSHPTLWHSLVLVGPPKKALRKLQEWRIRSQGLVEELTIRTSLGYNLFKPLDSPEMLHPDDLAMRDKILAELCHLDLAYVKTCHLENVDIASFLNALWGNMASGPETLSVSQIYPRHGSLLRTNESDIPSWTNVRVLAIKNMQCHWPAFTVFVHGLTSFEYKILYPTIHFEDIRALLQANRTLEKLVIETKMLASIPQNIDTPETLIMPHLRHFELSNVSLSCHCTQNLSLPMLQVLRLSGLPASAKVLEDFIDDPGTSFAELTELTMKTCTFQTPYLTSALFCSPRLEVLQLSGDFDANAIADSLSTLYSALPPVLAPASKGLILAELPVLCPSLSELDLSGSSNLTTGPVMRVVKQRLYLAASEEGKYRLPGQDSDQHVSSIQTLKVDQCQHIEAEVLPWFRKNVPMFSCQYFREWDRRAR